MIAGEKGGSSGNSLLLLPKVGDLTGEPMWIEVPGDGNARPPAAVRCDLMGIIRRENDHAPGRLARDDGGGRNKPFLVRATARHTRVREHQQAVVGIVFRVLFIPVIQGKNDRPEGTFVAVG